MILLLTQSGKAVGYHVAHPSDDVVVQNSVTSVSLILSNTRNLENCNNNI